MKFSENWCPYNPINHAALPSALREWLLHSGSFMAKLVECGVQDARVDVVRQDWEIPDDHEREQLGMPAGTQALAREVMILSEKIPWMFARTIFPRETLTGEESQLADLKNRSLGSVIFNDPTLQRSEFEIACLAPGDNWYERAVKHFAGQEQELWGRRSVFSLQGKKLLLTEVFFPDKFLL